MTMPSSGRALRIVCVSNGPLPYHTPILNELAAAARLEVIYMAHGHPLESFRDLWGVTPCFPYSFHWSWALTAPRHDFRAQLSVGVWRKLRRLDPDVVLVSSWGPLTWEPLERRPENRRQYGRRVRSQRHLRRRVPSAVWRCRGADRRLSPARAPSADASRAS